MEASDKNSYVVMIDRPPFVFPSQYVEPVTLENKPMLELPEGLVYPIGATNAYNFNNAGLTLNQDTWSIEEGVKVAGVAAPEYDGLIWNGPRVEIISGTDAFNVDLTGLYVLNDDLTHRDVQFPDDDPLILVTNGSVGSPGNGLAVGTLRTISRQMQFNMQGNLIYLGVEYVATDKDIVVPIELE
jgi:hypothetical protein